MKVNINFTVEVDIEGWNLSYGTETAAEVRKDVKDWITNAAYTGQAEGLIQPAGGK